MAIEYQLSVDNGSERIVRGNYRAKAIAHRDGAKVARAYGADRYFIARVIDNRRDGGSLQVLGEQCFRAA